MDCSSESCVNSHNMVQRDSSAIDSARMVISFFFGGGGEEGGAYFLT